MSPDPAERMDMDDRAPSYRDEQASGSSDDESGPEAPTDLMVVSRARRSNAGNRMSTLLAQSAEQEEWGEDWEEAPNEEEFVGDEANDQDDFNMDSSSSSSSDDDNEDDAGEKELRRAERQERVKKRKTATNPFAARLAAAARKRVKLDVPTAEQPAPVPRPKKKSERASWIPTPEDGPTRMSSRKQTVANKEHTLAKLKEKDRRRDDTLAMMKAAEARKAKDEPKSMTQAERLTEAARVERVNSRSLHRWEEAEEQRAAERQAKIDALKNRQIEGPFIRYYSGPAIWVDDKLKFTGKDAPKIEDLDEKLNKDVPFVAESQDTQSSTVEQSSIPEAAPSQGIDRTQSTEESVQQPNMSQSQASLPPTQSPQAQASQPTQTQTQASEGQSHDPPIGSHALPYPSSIMFAPPQSANSFLFGTEHYAKEQQGAPNENNTQTQPQNSGPQTSPNHQTPSTQPLQNGFQRPASTQPDRAAIPPNPFSQPSYQSPFSQPHPSLADPTLSQNLDPQSILQQLQHPPPAPAPPRRKVIRRALRNLLILSSFPNLDAPPATSRARTTSSILKDKDKSALIQLSSTLFGWSTADATAFVTAMLNAPKTKKEREGYGKVKKELCAVTNQIARYRDPSTGIAYRDQKAFGVLKGVVGGGFVWSGALGCYVGGRVQQGGSSSGVKPAMGVPKRFIQLSAKAPQPPPPPPGKVDAEKSGGTPAGDGTDVKMEDVAAS